MKSNSNRIYELGLSRAGTVRTESDGVIGNGDSRGLGTIRLGVCDDSDYQARIRITRIKTTRFTRITKVKIAGLLRLQ